MFFSVQSLITDPVCLKIVYSTINAQWYFVRLNLLLHFYFFVTQGLFLTLSSHGEIIIMIQIILSKCLFRDEFPPLYPKCIMEPPPVTLREQRKRKISQYSNCYWLLLKLFLFLNGSTSFLERGPIKGSQTIVKHLKRWALLYLILTSWFAKMIPCFFQNTRGKLFVILRLFIARKKFKVCVWS